VTADASLDKRKEAIPGFTDERREVTTYRAGFDAFWELDVFGRSACVGSRRESDGGQLRASLEDVRVVVAAEVARNYFELRGLQQRLAVAERSLTNQRETLRLTQIRRDAGIGEEFDVASAAARVAAIEASLPRSAPGSPGAKHASPCSSAAVRTRSMSICRRVHIRH